MLNRFSINLKVLVAPVAVMLLLICVSAGAIFALRSQGEAFRAVVGGAFDAATTTSQLSLTVAGIHSDMLRHAELLRVGAQGQPLEKLRNSLAQRFARADALLLSLEANSYSLDADLLHNVREFVSIYRIVATRITQAGALNPTLLSTLMAHHQQLDEYLNELASSTISSAKEKQKESEAFVARTVDALIVGAIVSLLIAGLISWLIGRAISQPLLQMTSLMSRLAAGDHGIKVPATQRRDEVGSMARAVEVFRQATLQLHEHEAELAKMVQRLEVMRDRAAAANRAKSTFLANMSHELRTPLNAVIGYAEMLGDGVYGTLPEKARSSVDRICLNAKHLLGLLNEVLDLSKIEAGLLTLRIADYQPRETIERVASSMEALAQAKEIALKVELPHDLPLVRGDEQRIAQTLLNLVGNAIKFTDRGAVTIGAALEDTSLKVSVRDTGPGIAEADRARIFEEFQQADDSVARVKGGTGLGLAIAKRIVELHGGRIGVDSALGQGADFWFVVPLNAQPQPAGQ